MASAVNGFGTSPLSSVSHSQPMTIGVPAATKSFTNALAVKNNGGQANNGHGQNSMQGGSSRKQSGSTGKMEHGALFPGVDTPLAAAFLPLELAVVPFSHGLGVARALMTNPLNAISDVLEVHVTGMNHMLPAKMQMPVSHNPLSLALSVSIQTAEAYMLNPLDPVGATARILDCHNKGMLDYLKFGADKY